MSRTFKANMERSSPKIEGGLRTCGAFHGASEPAKPLISIITVVRNGEKHLEQTIQSVLHQTYENIEYIVIDGASSDGTLGIIRKYEDRIAYWMSEPDKGIYDAMNKASLIASGDYALYLNADDYLYHEHSIEDLLRGGLDGGERPLLLVGCIVYVVQDKVIPDWIYPSSERQIHKYNPPHQATLIAASIYRNVFYKEIFTIVGDGDYWLDLRRRQLFQVKFVDTPVSAFRLGGASSDGKGEFVKAVEKQISTYIHDRHFSVIGLIGYFARAAGKRCLAGLMGESWYYRLVLYNAYRLRRHFVR